jgi:hypothetical protein
LPAEFHADARAIVRRLLAFADLAMKRAEKARGQNAMKSVNAAAKCLSLAMSYSRLLGDEAKPPQKDKLAEHLARRQNVVPIMNTNTQEEPNHVR